MSETSQVMDEDDYTKPGDYSGSARKPYKTGYEGERPGFSATWLISFTDLMGITLTFFVLLFTMSGTAKKDIPPGQTNEAFKEMSKFSGASGFGGPTDSVSLNKIDFNRALEPGYLKSVLEAMMAEIPVLKNVYVIEDSGNKRLILMLPQELLFPQGSAELSPEGKEAVQALAVLLKHIRNGIEIAGHADPVQPRADESGNWALSLSRALAVSEVISAEGYARGLPVKGYGSGLYESLPESLPEDRRQALARRVDIIINHHDGTAQQRFGIGQ